MTSTNNGEPTLGVVVLTTGDRPTELRALLDSVAAQEGDPAAVVVLGQGVPLPALPGGVACVELAENLGIPGGRNAGVQWLRENDGGHALRMTVIDQVGGFPARFFYAHEETDFAWRALDAGYRADMVLQHPRTAASRHAVYYRNTGRNRVWLAKRHLPAVLVPVYLATWAAYTIAQRPRCPAWPHGGPGSSRVYGRPVAPAAHAVADRVADDPSRPAPRDLMWGRPLLQGPRPH